MAILVIGAQWHLLLIAAILRSGWASCHIIGKSTPYLVVHLLAFDSCLAPRMHPAQLLRTPFPGRVPQLSAAAAGTRAAEQQEVASATARALITVIVARTSLSPARIT